MIVCEFARHDYGDDEEKSDECWYFFLTHIGQSNDLRRSILFKVSVSILGDKGDTAFCSGADIVDVCVVFTSSKKIQSPIVILVNIATNKISRSSSIGSIKTPNNMIVTE